jgi:hypothetical protein
VCVRYMNMRVQSAKCCTAVLDSPDDLGEGLHELVQPTRFLQHFKASGT